MNQIAELANTTIVPAIEKKFGLKAGATVWRDYENPAWIRPILIVCMGDTAVDNIDELIELEDEIDNLISDEFPEFGDILYIFLERNRDCNMRRADAR